MSEKSKKKPLPGRDQLESNPGQFNRQMSAPGRATGFAICDDAPVEARGYYSVINDLQGGCNPDESYEIPNDQMFQRGGHQDSYNRSNPATRPLPEVPVSADQDIRGIQKGLLRNRLPEPPPYLQKPTTQPAPNKPLPATPGPTNRTKHTSTGSLSSEISSSSNRSSNMSNISNISNNSCSSCRRDCCCSQGVPDDPFYLNTPTRILEEKDADNGKYLRPSGEPYEVVNDEGLQASAMWDQSRRGRTPAPPPERSTDAAQARSATNRPTPAQKPPLTSQPLGRVPPIPQGGGAPAVPQGRAPTSPPVPPPFNSPHHQNVCTPTPREAPAVEADLDLYGQPWYFEECDRKLCETKILSLKQDGAFVVRPSNSGGDCYPYAITVCYQSIVYNLRVRRRKDGKFAVGEEKPNECVFESVADMIKFHRSNPLRLVADKSRSIPEAFVTLGNCPQKT